MKRITVRSWEDLEAIPEGEWVEVLGGLDIEAIGPQGRKKGLTIVGPPKAAPARGPKARDNTIVAARKGSTVLVGDDDFWVPEGLDLDEVYNDYITVYRDDIVVPLPPAVARRFGRRARVRLEARVEGTLLVIQRRPRATPRRGSRRKRAA